jgi:hypothetical protein
MATVEQLVTKLKEDLLKRSALNAGVVVPGRGFGGRLVLPEAMQAATPQPSQKAPAAPYEALRGKALVLMDREGKSLGKPAVIGELAVTEGMVVAVVE